jgi:hypothetical protein
MGEDSELFVAFDVAKKKHAVAIAEGGRRGEIRFVGEIENSPATSERMKRLAGRYERLHVCFEAGPTGYELYRQIRALGHDCMVVAPALIPKRAGDRVKTNRRDAITLARLHRAGELTAVWVPDATHEAIRDLVRAREAAADDFASQTPAAAFVPAALWADLQRRRSLDAGASALARQAGVRACSAAGRVPGRHRRDRGRCAATASPGTAADTHRARLVHGASGCGVSGDARCLVPGCRHLCRGNRRCAPVRNAATADVVSRPGAGRELDRRHGATQGADPCGQSTRSPDLG